MFNALRNRIPRRINATTVIAVMALVFAMTGGAYAASKVLITSTKQISPKVLKALKGASGKAGAPGAAGPAGPAGVGAAGAKGETGPAGAPGGEGKAGKEGTAGKEGKDGKTGFTKTLPSGETEMGTWSVTAKDVPRAWETWTAISFPIGLEKPSASAFFITAQETEELDEGIKSVGQGNCAGTLSVPTAPKGELCVYTEEEVLQEASFLEIKGHEAPGYEPAGAYIDFFIQEGGTAKARGNWAVTAP